MATTPRGEHLDVLIDLLRRSPLLEELQGDGFDRRELQDRLDVSRATIHRHTRLLEELGVIEKVNGEFRLTPSGLLLAEAVVSFKREVSSALQLAPVLEAIGDAPIDIDIHAFAGARVTSAVRGDPYSPVVRFVALVRETESLRGFDIDVIAPVYLDEIQREIVEGMETETIALPEVAKDTIDGYPEKCIEACASGYLTVQLHDELPFGLAIFDDRVGIGVSEPDTRQLSVFADTDSPAVREWAETVYEVYDSEAVVLEEVTHNGFQQAMERQALS
ncbi:helix-turn-helix transcriptional regulator [Halosolutus halophilus]|uniref:helix-turn-helix transcriptional regulator n=1 Tax=Halosolutus halophilus TaxID=1552990 RepID=UPI00223516A8|nr:HTH domain-containing protein [Halosolutus halophilus]